MTVELCPYLSFRDDARPALEHYQSVLGGELTLSTFRDLGGMGVDEAELDKVMHGRLVTPDGMVLMGADTPSSVEHSPGGYAVSLSGDDEPRLRACFDGLSAGGTVREPLVAAPWGDVFGMLTDRFGVEWMVNISPAAA
jgi:PhnB protein